jgi:hypothetical protein
MQAMKRRYLTILAKVQAAYRYSDFDEVGIIAFVDARLTFPEGL